MTTTFPTQIVEINYRLNSTGPDQWMTATAESDGQRWEVSKRIPSDDEGGTATRKALGLRIMTGVQQMTAKPCDIRGCERQAVNHGAMRVNGDNKHFSVCQTCTSAISDSRPDGSMSVLLMPFFAFTEYDD